MKLFLVAGEASADLHAAMLLQELKKLDPRLYCYGVGGPRLKAEGMNIVVPASALNVVGISDWFDRAGEVVRAYRRLVRTIREDPPDGAVLLDLPDLNFLLAKKLKALRRPVAYYISPQVWAWRRYRLRKIRKYIDKMLVLFPFEESFYRRHGVDAEFVGHPLAESLPFRTNWRPFEERLAAPRIGILPGSRKSEIRFHGEVLARFVEKMKSKFSSATFHVPVAPTLSRSFVAEKVAGEGVNLYEKPAYEVLQDCDIAVVASGTATLETALIGIPFCLFYRVSRSSAWIFRTFVRYKNFIGMPNLLLGKEVVREFFQEEANGENLFSQCVRLLEDESYYREQIAALSRCRDLLGPQGASKRAAQRIFEVLRRGCFHTELSVAEEPIH